MSLKKGTISIQQGWSDKPETNSTMASFPYPATETTARRTQEKIQTNTVADRVHDSDGDDIGRTRSHAMGLRY